MTKQPFSTEPFDEEDEEKLHTAIKYLRTLLEDEKNLKVRKDDNFLLRYLRCSQYDPQLAFEKMRTYYTIKHEHPEWYVIKESISSFRTELENHLYYMLEDRDRFGKRIYVNRLGLIDASKTTMIKQSQLQDLFLECILDEEETQKCGLSIIVDLKNFSWNLLKWLTPSNVLTAVKKVESLPLKKLEIHVVNTTVLMNAAIKLIWPFLSAKTKENIHFHYENWPSLHKIIDPSCLPVHYGGTKLDLNIEKLLQNIPGNKEWLSDGIYVKDEQLNSIKAFILIFNSPSPNVPSISKQLQHDYIHSVICCCFFQQHVFKVSRSITILQGFQNQK